MRLVYFMECAGRIKIGVSSNVKARLTQLRQGSGGEIQLIAAVEGDFDLERALHNKLKPYRIDSEWFKDGPEVRAAIQQTVTHFPVVAGSTDAAQSRDDKFKQVCKVLWPLDTASVVAKIAGAEPRTASRWFSGESEPPGIVLAAIITELTKRN